MLKSETNTLNRNKIWLYLKSVFSSDSAELITGSENEDNQEENEQQDNNSDAIDVESEDFKSAVQAKVDEIISARVAREKEKTDAAELKYSEAKTSLDALTEENSTLKTSLTTLGAEKEELAKTALTLKLSIEEKVDVKVISALKGETEEELREAIKAVRGSAPNGDNLNRIFSGKEPSDVKFNFTAEALASARKHTLK